MYDVKEDSIGNELRDWAIR